MAPVRNTLQAGPPAFGGGLATQGFFNKEERKTKILRQAADTVSHVRRPNLLR